MSKPQESIKRNVEQSRKPGFKPRILNISEVEDKPIDWLWPSRIAKGRLTLLNGRPGLGKSYLTCEMAATVSTGRDWPDGTPCDVGSVLMLTAEDDPGDTIKPRLREQRAELSKCYILGGMYDPDDVDDAVDRSVSLDDVATIEEAIQEIGDVKLLIIDPIGSYLGSGTDSNRDNEVRAKLAPIAALAEKHGVAVLIVSHSRKSTATMADDLVMGSRAFTGICRAVWHLMADPEDEDRRLLLSGKSNLARKSTGLAFRIEGDPVGAIAWEPDPVDVSADDVLASEGKKGGSAPSAIDEAIDWLQSWLEDGAKSAKETKEAAALCDIKGKTLDRASKKVRVVKKPDGYRGSWQWSLPRRAAVALQNSNSVAQRKMLGETADTGRDREGQTELAVRGETSGNNEETESRNYMSDEEQRITSTAEPQFQAEAC